MKVGCYVTVDDGDNYVTFHGLNVRIKIKTITKAQLDMVSNRELKRGLNRTAVLFYFFNRAAEGGRGSRIAFGFFFPFCL